MFVYGKTCTIHDVVIAHRMRGSDFAFGNTPATHPCVTPLENCSKNDTNRAPNGFSIVTQTFKFKHVCLVFVINFQTQIY